MPTTLDDRRGTHILGEHAQHVAQAARDCQPDTHTPQQADAIMAAVLQCIELVGGATAASRPRAGAPEHPVLANRTRSNSRQTAPMNPVHRHPGTGQSGRPGGDSDTGYWRFQYDRVTSHYDRCDAVRQAGAYLAALIARDPNVTAGEYTEDDVRKDVLVEGAGWPLKTVAERFHRDIRTIAHWRIGDAKNPLTGKPWTAPTVNVFMAEAAREMKHHGLTSSTIAQALHCSASAVRMWTSGARRAA